MINFKDLFSLKEKLGKFKESVKHLSIEVRSPKGSCLGIKNGVIFFQLAQADFDSGIQSVEMVVQSLMQQLLEELKTKISEEVNQLGFDPKGLF